MEFKFRYRYVDFDTVFISDPGFRSEQAGAESPATLYANELVTDVGRTCWDRNEPLAILDHHFPREGQFPSASAAVLHKAKLIREKFGALRSDVVWLVTHKEPDFDAFCSMHLARWLIEDPAAPADWQAYGLHPDGCFDLAGARGIDWFDLHFHHVPAEYRWAVQLACYAAIVDNRRRIFCPRGRALHSILYVALKRGREYLSNTSGATQFFDEVRAALRERQLNPLFDSILEHSQLFAPERAMLDREATAYLRDLERARKAVVYLPESEAPFPNFFKSVKDVGPAQLLGKPANPVGHPTLSDTFRIPTDGIYLRDPECLLFKEWARLDLENSALGAGFELTAMADSQGRPAGTVNKTAYIFSLDPERANGRHLYTVWSRLQTMEVEALRGSEGAVPAPSNMQRGLEPRSEVSSSLFTDPWSEGQSYFGTLVAPPHRGTSIGKPGVRSDLLDDRVAEAVRTELENAIYLAGAATESPRITVSDFANSSTETDRPDRQFDLDAPDLIPAPGEKYFRFASIELRADVPIIAGGIFRRGLARQIADTLWRALHPDLSNEKPADFERQLVITSHSVGVWSGGGIAIACKPASATAVGQATLYHNEGLRENFAAIVLLTREIDQFVSDKKSHTTAQASASSAEMSAQSLAKVEDMVRRAAYIQHVLVLPDAELLRRFCAAIGLSQLLSALSSLSQSVGEQLLYEKLGGQDVELDRRAEEAAELKGSLGWLEVLAVGFYATAMMALGASLVTAQNRTWGTPGALIGGLVCLLMAAWIRKPWSRPHGTNSRSGVVWVLVVIVLSYVVALALWAGLGRAG